MKTVAVIQARTGSTRLPGKVLEVIHGKKVIDWVIERTQSAGHAVCLATTYEKEDDVLEDIAKNHHITCVRGPVNDVLDRFVRAAWATKAEKIIRITADNPMVDPDIIWGVDAMCCEESPYVTTSEDWPDGLDCEVVLANDLYQSAKYATLPSDREHVTTYLKKIGRKVAYYEPLNENGDVIPMGFHRWTLDEPADLEFLRAVFPLLPEKFTYHDTLRVLSERPELMKINYHIKRNEGYKKSVENDAI